MIVADKNKIISMAKNLSEDSATSGRSLWADARTRFMRNKAAITSLVILVLIVLFSFVGRTLRSGHMNKLIGILWVQQPL